MAAAAARRTLPTAAAARLHTPSACAAALPAALPAEGLAVSAPATAVPAAAAAPLTLPAAAAAVVRAVCRTRIQALRATLRLHSPRPGRLTAQMPSPASPAGAGAQQL